MNLHFDFICMHFRRSVARFLIYAALTCPPLHSQSQQSIEYQARSNRYEGLKSEFNAKPRYDVRGIFANEDLGSSGPRIDLKISFYIPPDAVVLNIQAQELQKNRGYLMVPNLPLPGAGPGRWATFSPWPVSEVLAKVPILPAQLGVVVNLKEPSVANLYAPVLFYTNRAPQNIKTYSIFLSSDKPVEGVHCTVVDQKWHSRAASGPYQCGLQNHGTSLPGGVTGRFEVSADNLPPGLITVTIMGEYANDESGQSLHAVVHFYHQPQVDAR